MSIISESMIPLISQRNQNNQVVRRRLYDYLFQDHSPETKIKAHRGRGGFTYALGSSVEEACINRAIAEVEYTKARAEKNVSLRLYNKAKNAIAHHRLLTAGKKKKGGDEEDEDEEWNPQWPDDAEDENETLRECVDELEEEIRVLKTTLRLLCEKYGEEHNI